MPAQKIKGGGIISIDDSIRDFIASDRVTSLSDSTRLTYEYALKNFWEHYQNKKVSDISDEMLAEFCRKLSNANKSAASIKQNITIIKLWLKHSGIKLDFTYRVPSSENKKRQLKHMERWFSEEEVEAILDYKFENGTALRNRIMIRLLFETGARIKEIACLEWQHIKIEDRTLWLRTSKTLPRAAFFSGHTGRMLTNLKKTIYPMETDSLFPDVAQCKNIFTEMLIALGMKKANDGRGPHTARHYVATYLYYIGLMEGNDIAVLLGDKWETIRDVYLHPTPAMLRSRVDKAMGWADDAEV